MEWLNVESKEELIKYSQKYGKYKFNKLKDDIRRDIDNIIKDTNRYSISSKNVINMAAKDWNVLFEKICILKEIFYKAENDANSLYGNNYFKSKSDELIFYILELSGKARNKKIGLNEEIFADKNLAKKWRNQILQKIHPDISKNPKADEAVIKLEQLYELVIK
ncbi:hypothetical protein [Clostridium thermobutyricum]|uniref:DnaJ domain protein n=1 Tax=Clostridium thermobutyricum DSM 4928 TaxID=1121339 RepID=A0A1V4SYD0_9CLOT|nr:hypothetical protein [Clostridium thermobutyricum]OPX49138.1 hypothetical protein CLTHE_08920 [Clostridium thermobutyricum DSM 4928]